jgi:hypothetical protein
MRRVVIWSVLLFVAMALHSRAEPWKVGVDCSVEDQSKYDRFEQSVRTAAPGSTVYVPKPYPTTDRQVIADFLYQYKNLHWEKADPRKLPQGEVRVLDGILESTVTFDVQRVENWNSTRCGREQRSDFFHLLRIFDAASGAEISRVAIHPSGLWAAKQNFYSGLPFLQLPNPNEVLRDEVAISYDVSADRGSAQYVVYIGGIVCGFTEPCIAFRHGSDAYLFLRSKRLPSALFKIAGDEPRYVLRPGDVLHGRLEAIPAWRRTGPLFQLGGNTWTIAREVAKSSGAPARQ